MSIDLNQFHTVFFEESQEHLDTMEQRLMDLDLGQPDPEDLNSIFRAAHSIKGGSGIFGFSALGQITHVMENLLDQLRQGQRHPDNALIDLLLSVVDCLRRILERYREEAEPDWDEVASVTKELEQVLACKGAGERDDVGALQADAESDAFGFFDDPPAEKADCDSANTDSADRDDTGWGLFEDGPASGAGPPADSGAGPDVDASAAFGFFDEPTAPAEANPDSVPSSPGAAAAGAGQQAALRKSKAAATSESATIRVGVDKVDSLINLVGELVITQSMLKVLGEDPENLDPMKMATVLAELERHTREIQESVMSIRMIPVSFVFNRFPRVVRDLAGKLDKKVELVLEGTQTELDKGLIEKLVDPLTHLVRNSIDHGIETPDRRRAAGKPEQGTIVISASQRGGSIVIAISDDGAGLNRERILAKARENGLAASDDLPDQEVWELIFQPGFSTAEQVTDVSGRGVGMDVVRRNIQQLGGRIEIASSEHQGSTFTIQLPLTLAIVDGMGVSVGGQTFIIPLVSIVESMQPPAANLNRLAGSNLLHVREEYWPLLPLGDVMDVTPRHRDPADAIVVLIETTKRRYGLVVDELVGQQQVVIKSLEQHYKRVPGTAGATIMGDGSVAMILDVESLADIVQDPIEEAI
ncbi:chemotaxis protein CheA [Marinobacter sp. CA1]|uniref:chemotaxis protein CheA n=1 Tax=Marinobacter sp. CA1 TaxID=2817656 RepID=UPI001D072814|nr:chemotaxis protein CheW [Marinobacter sp. CA1]UDL06402.1 chemotaxis protein CheW [Marinobacter sp. CA1]